MNKNISKGKRLTGNDITADPATRIKKAVEKTGFLFEKQIADILENAGWTVINNRYYIDSTTNVPREMDIVSYRVAGHEDIFHYFVLVISCKKSAGRDWVFLTKEKSKSDKNTNWLPLTQWTNSKIMKVTAFERYWEKLVKTNASFDIDVARIFDIQHNIYGFQEIENDKPYNDKAIFASIDSLLKAVNFEINSLPKRKKESVFYTFNLLTVLDGNMYEAFIHDNDVDIVEANNLKYINRFIVDTKDAFYRLQFCTKSFFPELLESYNRYYLREFRFFQQRIDAYYENCLENAYYRNAFIKEIDAGVKQCIRWYIERNIENTREISLSYDVTEKILELGLDITAYDVEKLNSNKDVTSQITELVKTYLHYNGAFKFVYAFF